MVSPVFAFATFILAAPAPKTSIHLDWGCAKDSPVTCLGEKDIEFWCPEESMAGEDPCQEQAGTPEFDSCQAEADAEQKRQAEASQKQRQRYHAFKKDRSKYSAPMLRIDGIKATKKKRPFVFVAVLHGEYPDEPVLPEDGQSALLPVTVGKAGQKGKAALAMPLGFSVEPQLDSVGYDSLYVVYFTAASKKKAEKAEALLKEDCRDGCDAVATLSAAGLAKKADIEVRTIERKCLPVGRR